MCEPSAAPLSSGDGLRFASGLNWADWRVNQFSEIYQIDDEDGAVISSERLDRLVLDCLPLMRRVVASTTWFDLDFAAPEAVLGQRSATTIAPVLVAAVQAVLAHDPDVPRIAIRIRRIGHRAALMVAGQPRQGRVPVNKGGITSSSLVRLAIVANLGLSFHSIFGRDVITMTVPVYVSALQRIII